MVKPDHSAEGPWVTTGKARFAAAATPEEKLAVLRDYEDEETAQAYLSDSLRRERGESFRDLDNDTFTPEDLAEEAPTREAKLAVLREHYPEDQAQESLRLMELRPHVDAAPTRAEKLAILHAHFSEETVQDVIGSFMQRQADKEPPLSVADAACADEWHKVDTTQWREILARVSTISEPEARLAVMRDYVSDEAVQYMIRRTMDKGTGDAASPG